MRISAPIVELLTELEWSEGVSWDELKRAYEELQVAVRWLYWRNAHYSQGLPDIDDVPILTQLKDLDWIHEEEAE